MINNRRDFLKKSLSGAALLSIGNASLLEKIIDQEKVKDIQGVGVKKGVVQLIWNEYSLC